MKTLGNIIWLLFGGILITIEYYVASILLIFTIIGVPFAVQTLKMGGLALWPFSKEIRPMEKSTGCIATIMNIIWFFIGGIWIALSHAVFGLFFFITIIGIPFGKQHFKLAALALAPFGKEIIHIRVGR